IEDDVSKNKKSEKIQSKLTDITNKLDSAYTTYKSKIDKDKMSDEDKKKSKNINKLNKELNSAMDDIRDGYNEKDKKKIQKDQDTLSKVSIRNNYGYNQIGVFILKQGIFYIVIAIALIGLLLNLDAFLFSFVKMIISLAIFAGIIYAIYYFFFLTEDQRK